MCFFQECHSTLDSENEWKKNWNGQIYFSHGQSNSTGCAIAFSENLDIKIDDSKISRLAPSLFHSLAYIKGRNNWKEERDLSNSH